MITEQAKRDLAEFLPHLKLAVAMARIEAGPDGKVELGVLGVHPDGTGQIVARFETGFIDDLEKILTEGECQVKFAPAIKCELSAGHEGEHKFEGFAWPNAG